MMSAFPCLSSTLFLNLYPHIDYDELLFLASLYFTAWDQLCRIGSGEKPAGFLTNFAFLAKRILASLFPATLPCLLVCRSFLSTTKKTIFRRRNIITVIKPYPPSHPQKITKIACFTHLYTRSTQLLLA